MAKEFISEGATCICKFGTSRVTIQVRDHNLTKLNGDKVCATTQTLKGAFGPLGFKTCNASYPSRKCTPKPVMWSGFFRGLKIGANAFPLTDASKCTCAVGGKDCIEFLTSGQIPIPGQMAVRETSGQLQNELDPMGEPEALDEHPITLGLSIMDQNQKILVTAVKGPNEAFAGQKVKYEVERYNVRDVNEGIRSQVKWKITIDDREIVITQPHKEVLELPVKNEWQGKKIVAKAYIKTPSDKVTKVTKIETFKPVVFLARSQNWAGQTANGNRAEDMMCGDKNPEDVLAINKLFKYQLRSTDEQLFNDMAGLFQLGTFLDGKENASALIAHFKANTGHTFSSSYMNEQLRKHETLERFVYDKKDDEPGVLALLCEQLRLYDGNINEIKLQIGKIKSTRVKFNSFDDKLRGMTLAIDDTSAYQVYVDDYKLNSPNRFCCKLRIDIYDHFGLDQNDVQKYGSLAGFRAWYVLQHIRGYKPFLTNMHCEIELSNHSFR